MILIVDDHRDTRRAMAMLLTRYGYEVCAVDSGMAALEHLRAGAPHCVILDYNMPEMNGLEVLAAIRSDARLDAVHVILFTAQNDPALRDAALAGGASDFVCKGTLDFAQIDRVVGKYCTPKSSPRPLVRRAAQRDVG